MRSCAWPARRPWCTVWAQRREGQREARRDGRAGQDALALVAAELILCWTSGRQLLSSKGDCRRRWSTTHLANRARGLTRPADGLLACVPDWSVSRAATQQETTAQPGDALGPCARSDSSPSQRPRFVLQRLQAVVVRGWVQRGLRSVSASPRRLGPRRGGRGSVQVERERKRGV